MELAINNLRKQKKVWAMRLDSRVEQPLFHPMITKPIPKWMKHESTQPLAKWFMPQTTPFRSHYTTSILSLKHKSFHLSLNSTTSLWSSNSSYSSSYFPTWIYLISHHHSHKPFKDQRGWSLKNILKHTSAPFSSSKGGRPSSPSKSFLW